MSDNHQLTQALHQWLVLFAHRSMQDVSRFVKAAGLSIPQFAILMHVFHCKVCGVSDISERMEITNAAASQLIDRLVGSGLIARTEDPDDRRAKMITLTEDGKQLLAKSMEERFRWIDRLVVSISDEEKTALLRALPALIQAMQKLDDHGN